MPELAFGRTAGVAVGSQNSFRRLPEEGIDVDAGSGVLCLPVELAGIGIEPREAGETLG